MKVLIINGSPRLNGNTTQVLNEMKKVLIEEELEVEIFQVGTKNIRGCIACNKCRELGKCIFDDVVNELLPKLHEADALVVATPVYYASANGTLISLLDRLFYANQVDLSMKVGASIAIARRGGASATFDELNKYFTISGMPIVSSYYWNSVHGKSEGEALQDKEGIYTIRMLAKNLAFLVKSINLGKEKYGLPKKEKREITNFIR
ncbi:MAG: flavodoxin family protein [Bacilli bacterium]|nr:flavodoxin family protein [Bacilli bacterium]MDY4051886.1 flavodoxin family protein [Bacilli bacterium]